MLFTNLYETTGHQGQDNLRRLLNAIKNSQDVELIVGNEPITLTYPEARYLGGQFRAFQKAGKMDEFLRHLVDPVWFDAHMAKLRGMIDRQRALGEVKKNFNEVDTNPNDLESDVEREQETQRMTQQDAAAGGMAEDSSEYSGPHGKMNIDRSRKGVTRVTRQGYAQGYVPPGTGDRGRKPGEKSGAGGYAGGGVGAPQKTSFSGVASDAKAGRMIPRFDYDTDDRFTESHSNVKKLNDYNQWLDRVDAMGADKHMQKNQTLIVAQSWDGEKVGEFDTRAGQGWIMSQGVAEGFERFQVGDKISFPLSQMATGIVDKIDDKRLYVKLDNGEVYTIPSSMLHSVKLLERQGVAEGADDIAQAKERLAYLEKIFDTSYEYSDDHSVWRKHNAIRQEMDQLKRLIAQGNKNVSEELAENLHKWFKEKWVRFGPDGKIRGDCARGDDSEGKPKCLPASKAHALGKKGRASAAARKRREDPNPERSGAAINVATKKKSNEAANPAQQAAIAIAKKKAGDPPKTDESQLCPECGGAMYEASMMNEKKDACYYKVKSRYKVWPSAYASGALVKCRKKGAKNWGSKSESVELDERCWDTHRQAGMKKKGNRMVPNCVPKEDIEEDWQKVNKRDKTDGMSQKAVNAYRRENPGSKLKTAVTTKPSKLKRGSKASKRRSSYCSRSAGQKKMHHIDCSKTPDKAICKARRRWNCEESVMEGRVKEIAIEYQDYKHLPEMAFQSRYKMSKGDWWAKYGRMVQGSGLGIGLNEFAPGDGSDRGMDWTQLVNYMRRTLDSFGFSFEGSQNFAEYSRGNDALRLEYDPSDPAWFGWALGRYAGNFDVMYSGTDPLTIDSADQVLEYVDRAFGFRQRDVSEVRRRPTPSAADRLKQNLKRAGYDVDERERYWRERVKKINQEIEQWNTDNPEHQVKKNTNESLATAEYHHYERDPKTGRVLYRGVKEAVELPGTKGDWVHGGFKVRFDPATNTVRVFNRSQERSHSWPKAPTPQAYRIIVQQLIDRLEDESL